MPLSASAGTIGSVPPVRSEERTFPERTLEGVLRQLDGGRLGRDEPRWSRRPALDLELGAFGGRLAQEPLEGCGDLVDVLARRKPDGDVRLGVHREHRLLKDRRAAGEAVHVEAGSANVRT